MRWVLLSSERGRSGDANAQFYLGLMYANGRALVIYKTTVQWWRRAADQEMLMPNRVWG
ncbi:MAG: hypothetical protein ACYYK0_01565 [Candidatus Eutrophobiaceae bacterium]